MNTLKETVDDFLAQKRIAVAGISRKGDSPANFVYRKLRDAGHQVFAVNPNADRIEGDPCYPDLASIPGGVDAVFIATHPAVAPKIVGECAALGIRRVWMHRLFGEGSVSREAVDLCRRHGIDVIAGACPMMYCEPVDFGHRCFRWILGVTGKLPKPERMEAHVN